MRQLTVGTSQTLISTPGNRDFCAIYNNGSVTCYLCFDGDDGLSSLITTAQLSSPLTNGTVYTSITVAFQSAYSPLVGTPFVGQLITGTGIPAGTYVTSVTPPIPNAPNGANQSAPVWTIGCSFTASANSAGNNSITFGQTALTASNGFPLPAATWMNFDNSSFRNVQNKAIYGICASSTTDLRIQGG